MPKYFLSDTPLASMERNMMAVPGFAPRCSGCQIARDHTYTAEDVQCKYCERYKRRKCTSAKCPWMLERLQAGVIGYKDLVRSCSSGKPNRRIISRIESTYAQTNGSRYRSKGHRERMEACLQDYQRFNQSREPDPQWLAIIFLLTASKRVWASCSKGVTLMSIDLRAVVPLNFSTQDYALFQMARSLWDRKQRISENELANRTLIREETFTVLMDALVLAEYGVALLPTKEKEAPT